MLESIHVSRDPFGRAILKALTHLQEQHGHEEFDLRAMPPLDPDYRAEWSNVDAMADEAILRVLRNARLIEPVGGSHPKYTYRLTDKGRDTAVVFKGAAPVESLLLEREPAKV